MYNQQTKVWKNHNNYTLAHLSLASLLWDLGKQCNPERRLISVHCLLTRISISNGTKHEKIHLTPLKRQVDSTNVYGWESPLGLLGLILVGPSLWIYFHTFRGSWTEISLKTLVFPSITYLSHRPSWSSCLGNGKCPKSFEHFIPYFFFYLNTAFMQLFLKYWVEWQTE